MVDAIDVEAWQASVIDRIATTPTAGTVAAVIVVDGAPRAASPPLAHWSRPRSRRRDAGWRPPAAIRTVSARPLTAGTFDLEPSETDALRALELDTLVHLGSGTPVGGILGIARRGTLQIRFGEGPGEDLDRAVLRSLLNGDPTVRATLVRRDPSDGTDEVLRTGWFATLPASYATSRDRVLLGTASWPALACRAEGTPSQLATPIGTPGAPAAAERRPGAPGRGATVRLVGVVARAWAARLWHHGWRHDDWAVGVIDRPVGSFLERVAVEDVRWAPETPGHYTADPFGTWRGDRLEVAYEDYDHARGRATIAVRAWGRDTGWQAPSTVLDIGSHLSYPFLVEDGERLRMMPESQASGSLVLYASDDGVRAWRPWRTVDLPMTVADATLLHRDGRWWLFACRADGLNPATELWLWHTDTLEGPWTEHPANPVVVDVRAARPAGPLFEVAGSLYRPAQDCSTGYGDRLAIRHVTELTVERYQERTVAVVEPERDGPYPYGLHTLTGVGDVTLVDGKRRVRHLGATLRGIRRRLPGGR
jgi:hypothetical protein